MLMASWNLPKQPGPWGHALNRFNTWSLHAQDGTSSLFVENGSNSNRERLVTETRGELTCGVGVGAQKSLWEVWKKEKGNGLCALRDSNELMQLSRT